MEQNQEIPRILWNTKFHHRIHKRRTAVPTLSHSNPIHASLSHFLKVYFNIIFPFTPRSSKCSLCLSSVHGNLAGTSPISHSCHLFHPSHSAWFDNPNENRVPNLKSHFYCLCCTKGSVQVRGLMKCLVTSFLQLGVASNSPNSHLGRPPLVGRPKLLCNIWAATYLASCTLGTGSFPGVKSGRGVTLTLHLLLVPWSWKGRTIPLLPLWAVRPIQSLSACTRVHLTFRRLTSTIVDVPQR